MKLILFGIAMMLFGWITELTFALEMFAFLVSAVGFIFAIVGLASKENK